MTSRASNWPDPVPYSELSERQQEILEFSLELPVSLLAVFPGDRQRGWANRPERRALPDSRARAQRVGTTTPGFRRHRFADIRETRNRFASSRSLAPASIISAAASRTCSRRARSAASRPPPSGYLIHPA